MMADTGISRAMSPTFRSSVAMAPLPAPSTSIRQMMQGIKMKVHMEQ